ncbi:hypothetical protein GCM10020295_34190 [Streptomyces cinereospinus]
MPISTDWAGAASSSGLPIAAAASTAKARDLGDMRDMRDMRVDMEPPAHRCVTTGSRRRAGRGPRPRRAGHRVLDGSAIRGGREAAAVSPSRLPAGPRADGECGSGPSSSTVLQRLPVCNRKGGRGGRGDAPAVASG